MKIAIFGAGAVGGYIGAILAQAGKDVTFIARGKHLDAIITEGLQVQSINGDFTVHPVKATDRPDNIGTVDLVLCCVKSWQVSEVSKCNKIAGWAGNLGYPDSKWRGSPHYFILGAWS